MPEPEGLEDEGFVSVVTATGVEALGGRGGGDW
jgi:hypothetical protein